MAHVVLLRGVNVGGHRTFRPKQLAEQLKHLRPVNIGAAGTFVIRKPISQAKLRDEFARRLPFETDIMICHGRDFARLLSHRCYASYPPRRELVRFVSVLSRAPRSTPTLPITLPPAGKWLLKILARDGRFVLGVYRRHMKVIGYLGSLDRTFAVPGTTRNWNTIVAIGEVLRTDERPQRSRRLL